MILKLIDRSDFTADSARNLTSDVVLYHGFQLCDMVRLEEQANLCHRWYETKHGVGIELIYLVTRKFFLTCSLVYNGIGPIR